MVKSQPTVLQYLAVSPSLFSEFLCIYLSGILEHASETLGFTMWRSGEEEYSIQEWRAPLLLHSLGLLDRLQFYFA